MQINLRYVVVAMGVVILLLLIYIMFLHMRLILSQSKNQQPIVINNYAGTPNNQPQSAPVDNSSNKLSVLPQSSFFMDSIGFAEKFVRGQVKYDSNIPLTQSALKTLNALSVFNDQIKEKIITAINYNAVDAANAMNNENRLRGIALNEKTPLWIVIIKEAMGKVVPNMNSSDQFNPNAVTDNTQIPAGTFPRLLNNN